MAWAHRNLALHGSGEPVVVCGSVARGDVLAVLVERLEMEVLAFPEDVTVEAVEDVGGETPPTSTEHARRKHHEIEPG